MKNILKILIPVAVIALAVILIVVLKPKGRQNYSDSVAEGIAYLEKLEGEGTAAVENILAEKRQARMAAERAERMEELTNGTVDVWSLYTDYALLGDSRAVGFSYHGFLSEDRVIAGGGWTIRDIEANIETLRALNPSSIYLCFGLNDTSIGFWETADEYAAEFLTVLQMLGNEFPNATVYTNSILPARDPAFEQSQKWYEIPDYSAAVGKMCEENGYIFVNNDQIAQEHADLWDEDGIHLQKEFYPYWAANMMLSVYSGGTQDYGTVTEEIAEE